MRIKNSLLSVSLAGAVALPFVFVASRGGSSPSYEQIPAQATAAAGVSLAPLSASQQSLVKVTSDQAIAASQSYLGSAAASASSTTVSLGSFTDTEYGSVVAGAKVLVANGVPAYVVTFDGLTLSLPGPSAKSNTEASVVVNALTGAVIEMYSYR